jgi:hypothetical protein
MAIYPADETVFLLSLLLLLLGIERIVVGRSEADGRFLVVGDETLEGQDDSRTEGQITPKYQISDLESTT